MPKVSVIIPVYNVEKYVMHCLESVAAQTLRDIEILCIDDRGSDDSMALVERFVNQEPRAKIIRHEVNKKLGAARNTGLIHAQAEYVSFVDSDDWLLPKTLESEYDAISKECLECVWVKLLIYDEITGRYEKDLLRGIPATGAFNVSYQQDLGFPFMPCNKMFRKKFLIENGLSFPDGILYEDTEFFYKFHALSPNVRILDEHAYVYRVRSNSIMHQTGQGRGSSADYCTIGRNCYHFLHRHNIFENQTGLFLDFLAKIMMPSFSSKFYKNEIFAEAKKMLNDIGFPEQYENSRSCFGYTFFDIVQKSEYNEKMFKWYTPLSFLNKLNPIPDVREKWRTWLKINCLAR